MSRNLTNVSNASNAVIYANATNIRTYKSTDATTPASLVIFF